MVAFRIVHALKAARRVLLSAAITVPAGVLPQDVSNPAADAGRQEQLLEQILEAQSGAGQSPAELIEAMAELALLYQEQEDHALAIAAAETARQVVRANLGLYSLEEAPLLRLLVRSKEALGDAGGAWAHEQQLLSLAERHRGDRRTLPIYREIGDRRLDVLERYLAGEFPPQIVLGCYYRNDSLQSLVNESLSGRSGLPGCRAGGRSGAAFRLLRETLAHYGAATDVMLEHDLHTYEALRDLEMSAVRALYAYLNGIGRDRTSTRLIAEGESRLHRIAENAFRNEAPISEQIDALLLLPDWHLRFWRGPRREAPPALEAYTRVYEQLMQQALPQTTIDAIFSPDTPVVLPSFLPNPLASVQTPESSGWIDVAFDITSRGRGERIDMLDTTRATQEQRRALVDVIRRSRFRPRVVDGELADTTRVVLRYYVND